MSFGCAGSVTGHVHGGREQNTVLDLRKEEVEKAIQRQLERSKQRRDSQGRSRQRDVKMCVSMHVALHRRLTACAKVPVELERPKRPAVRDIHRPWQC